MKSKEGLIIEAQKLLRDEYSIDEYFRMLSDEDQKHCLRVEELSVKIALELKETPIDLENLRIAARYHDVGKVKIPKKILHKKTALSKEERAIIMVHSKYSSQILEYTGFNKSVVRFAMLHHENFDGTGYPFGLVGEQIPIESRIIRVADVYDALHSARQYKHALQIEICFKVMKNEADFFDESVFQQLQCIIGSNSYTEFKTLLSNM